MVGKVGRVLEYRNILQFKGLPRRPTLVDDL